MSDSVTVEHATAAFRADRTQQLLAQEIEFSSSLRVQIAQLEQHNADLEQRLGQLIAEVQRLEGEAQADRPEDAEDAEESDDVKD